MEFGKDFIPILVMLRRKLIEGVNGWSSDLLFLSSGRSGYPSSCSWSLATHFVLFSFDLNPNCDNLQKYQAKDDEKRINYEMQVWFRTQMGRTGQILCLAFKDKEAMSEISVWM